MRLTATLAAEAVLDELAVVPQGTTHPVFNELMAHSQLEPMEYLVASARSHAPLTDLRLRRDESSKSMLFLNLEAMSEAGSNIADVLCSMSDADPGDHLASELLTWAGAVPGGTTVARAPLASTTKVPDFCVAMAKYVDVFGSWADAADIAAQVRENTSLFLADDRRYSLFGLTATVLGLDHADGYDRLFEEAVTSHPVPSEAFFWGLRWASIEAKRRGQLGTAHQVISSALTRMESQVLESYDRDVMQGMAYNFLALLALRNRDVESAQRLVDRAIGKFGDDPSRVSILPADEAARYAWMAKLNRAQLPLLRGDYSEARVQLDPLLTYAREYDPTAVHTTLSALAFTFIRSGDAVEAKPLLLEALDLLTIEYDPNVVRQVRKMLFATYSALGAPAAAERVATDSLYFWRSARAVERYEL